MTTPDRAGAGADRAGARAWLRRPVEAGPRAGFGVYLHVPFCRHRCGYCDFAVTDRHHGWRQRFAAAMREEVRRAVAAGPTGQLDRHADAGRPPRAATDRADWPTVTSVFVGGGTPTQLDPGDLGGVLEVVRSEVAVAGDAEVTVEANPEDADHDLLARLAAGGVTRLSFGVQSFDPAVLDVLERGHGPAQAAAAVARSRSAGIPQVSLDLIHGAPGETAASWAATLRAAVASGPDHLSAYALTIHPNTAFGRRVVAGTLPAPDDDVHADRFAVADALLAEAGLEHYEISNWASSSSTRSRHNVLYWRHGDYLAVGPGAHGHWRGTRWWSARGLPSWVRAVEHGRSPVVGGEVLDDDERATERLLLGLRLREGLHRDDVPPIAPDALADAVRLDLVTMAAGRLRCTERGWYVLDEAVRRLR